jgi:hypothetical protein
VQPSARLGLWVSKDRHVWWHPVKSTKFVQTKHEQSHYNSIHYNTLPVRQHQSIGLRSATKILKLTLASSLLSSQQMIKYANYEIGTKRPA